MGDHNYANYAAFIMHVNSFIFFSITKGKGNSTSIMYFVYKMELYNNDILISSLYMNIHKWIIVFYNFTNNEQVMKRSHIII